MYYTKKSILSQLIPLLLPLLPVVAAFVEDRNLFLLYHFYYYNLLTKKITMILCHISCRVGFDDPFLDSMVKKGLLYKEYKIPPQDSNRMEEVLW